MGTCRTAVAAIQSGRRVSAIENDMECSNLAFKLVQKIDVVLRDQMEASGQSSIVKIVCGKRAKSQFTNNIDNSDNGDDERRDRLQQRHHG